MGRGASGKNELTVVPGRGFAAKQYRLLTPNGFIWSDTPGRFGGITTMKIFGRLDCKSGMRAKKENRVFFASWEDALACGMRPCKNCKPLPGDSYDRVNNRWQPSVLLEHPFDLDEVYPDVGAGEEMASAATTMREQGDGECDCAGYDFDYDFHAGPPRPTFRQVLAAGEAERRALYGFLTEEVGLVPFRHEAADTAQALLAKAGLKTGPIEVFAHTDDVNGDPGGYSWVLGGSDRGGVSLGCAGAIVIGNATLNDIDRWLESGEVSEWTFDSLATVLHEAIHQASPDPGRAFGGETEEADEAVVEALTRLLAPRFAAELAERHRLEAPSGEHHAYDYYLQRHPEVFALKERDLVQLVKLWAHQRPATLKHLGWSCPASKS